MKTLLKSIMLTVGASAIGVMLAATGALAQEFTLKFHQFLPAQAPIPAKVLVPWMAKIEKESGGRIKFEHYPSMQLGGKPGELVDQVVDGVADIVWTLPGYTPGRFPRTEVLELPFTMTNAEAASRTFWQLAEKHMFAADFKDMKILGTWTHGPGLIHSKTPITKIEDLKGVKLRAPTRVTNMMVTALGATAVGMPIPAVPEALSKGVIDATIIPWEVTASIKSSELVKNHTEFTGASLYTSTFIMAMNKGVYDKMPADLKAVIDANTGEEFSAFAGKTSQEADAPAREMAVKLGNNIIQLTPDQVEGWKTAAQSIIETWIAETGKAGFDGKALLDEAKAAMTANTK
ncbi:MAG: TRAP transporter substrate-binding protein [Phyllobacteriaceae bacterium]|nr:TRAP transporter substrate-binding protein [Phyllobacteriaceae bacterium]